MLAVIWLSGIAGALLGAEAHADAMRPWTLDRYQHVSWTGKNGAPTGVAALAQTSDGFLWLGTDNGLYRFDGNQFHRFEPAPGESLLSTPIYALYAPPGGGLWMSYEAGGVSLYKDGHLTHFGTADGLPGGKTFDGFAQDADGHIWTWGYGLLYRLEGRRWGNVGTAQGLKGNHAMAALFTKDGTLWVGTDAGLFYRPPHTSAFKPLDDERRFVATILQGPDGKIWVSDLHGSIHRWSVTPHGPVRDDVALQFPDTGVLVFDKLGGLWIGGMGDGLRHLVASAALSSDQAVLTNKLEHITKSDGLSGDFVWPLLEDREGNLWVGTGAGLDRFSRSNFTVAPFPSGAHDFALAPGVDGGVWTGSSSHPVMHLSDAGEVTTVDIPPFTLAAHASRHGDVLFGSIGGLWRVTGSSVTHLASLPDVGGRAMVQALAEDGQDGLWVSINSGNGGLFHWSGGQWVRIDGPAIPRAMRVEENGRLWLGYRGNKLAILDHGRLEAFDPAKLDDIGDIKVITEGAGRVWIGGSHGLAYEDSGRLHRVKLDPAGPLSNVTGVVPTPEGDVWVHTLDGVFRLAAADVQRAEADAAYAIPARRFDSLDGLPGAPALQVPLPSAIRTNDGRIWFATSNGVAWTDPSQLLTNQVAPPVVIQTIEADGKALSPTDGMALPKGTRNLRVGFAALGFAMPERLQVKFRMRGSGDDWQNAGALREANYHNLRPGAYLFEVMAANEDGVWSSQSTSLRFTIQPAFYQTSWFATVCAVTVTLLLWWAFVQRLKYEGRLVASRVAARHAERERIARELHDTLLQGMHGLLLRLQVWAGDGDISAKRRAEMDRAVLLTQQLLEDGRDRIATLREGDAHIGPMAPALRSLVEGLNTDAAIRIELGEVADEIILPRTTIAEVLAIAREAIVNALSHAKASAVRVELVQARDEIRLAVADDGDGIPVEVLRRGGLDGHWGIVGMRERADRARARLSIQSRPGHGTTVIVVVRREAFAS